MWTPKRIIMLNGCFAAFFTLYLSYAFSGIGRIDGLPPLPEAYRPEEGQGGEVRVPDRRTFSRLDLRLKEAFGAGCEERKWAIRLDLHKRNMVLAAQQFQLTPDGRVCLTPLSVALFGKDRG